MPENEQQTILISYPDPKVALITLNRPNARNALNLATRKDLALAFNQLTEQKHIHCVIITGNAKFFAAGADLKEFINEDAISLAQKYLHKLWQAVSDYPRPIIAAVNGYALGAGAELAMHCDCIIAGKSAVFGLPEIKVGIMPGAGGTQRLIRLIGRQKALKYLLIGDLFSASTAESMGMISEVVADDKVLESALALALNIAAMPIFAIEQIKEVVNLGEDAPLASALALERKASQLLFASLDQKEGMQAFIEKRSALFIGK